MTFSEVNMYLSSYSSRICCLFERTLARLSLHLGLLKQNLRKVYLQLGHGLLLTTTASLRFEPILEL